GRHEEHIWTDVQAYGQQVMAIEPQDRPTVRLEIANGPQAAIEHFGTRQIGKHDEIVHFTRAAMLLIDRADLHREQKAYLVATGGWQLLLDSLSPWVFEAVQTFLGRLQFLLQLGGPGWVCEITCAHDSNALERRPFVEIFEIQLTARGPGIARMDVEIGDKLHGGTFSQSVCANAGCCKSPSYTIDKLQTAISFC